MISKRRLKRWGVFHMSSCYLGITILIQDDDFAGSFCYKRLQMPRKNEPGAFSLNLCFLGTFIVFPLPLKAPRVTIGCQPRELERPLHQTADSDLSWESFEANASSAWSCVKVTTDSSFKCSLTHFRVSYCKRKHYLEIAAEKQDDSTELRSGHQLDPPQ